MKMHFTLSNIFIILLCLSSIVFAQLNGPYTIGSTGDFADFTEAVDSLESQGVDGPVVFDVQDGIYEEQMEINYITGASETNTITFQSESGDSTTVVLKYEASSNDNNFIVKLNGGSYITFRGIRLKTAEATYGKAVELDGSSQNITFTNCYFTGIYNTNRSAPYFLVNSSSAGNDNLTFQYCFIDSAAIFIYLQGVEANTNDNIRLIGNTIQNIGYAGLECSNVSRLIVQDNVIDAHSYGLRINSCYAGSIIRGNKMYSDNWGMYINGHGSGLSHCLVANNFIFSASQEAVTARGEYLDIYNNSIYSSNSYWLNKGLWLITDMQNYEINIVNNNICNMKAGLALRVDYGASINNCSNNNLYTPGNFLAYWDSVKCIDLAELQLKSAMNENSLTVYPNFVSDTDLHLVGAWLDGKGSPIAEITDDIDGETRDGSNPDIGADEYNPGIVPTLSGTYTIGSGGDYSSIQEAADDASQKGISASVTFNILPGAYNEQIDIHSIPGASSNNRVTFRSSTGDTTDVKITFANAIYDSNYTIRNFGADFISYENLTFESNTSGYARILDLYRGSDSIEVRNCHFIGLKSNGNESLYAGDSYYRSRIVEGNLFTGNRYAIYMRRNQNGDELTNGTQIIDNTMEDVTHTGIYLQWHYAPIINQNNIRIASDGIALHTCDGPYKVTNNRIESWTSGTGIYVSTSTASELQPGLIANNFISATSANGNNVGISIGNCIYQDVLYNSVNLMSNYYDNRAIELNTGTAQNINIQNNNFSCINNGYAMHVYSDAVINTADYNNLYCAGNLLANWNGVKIYDMAELKAVSGMNLNSQNVYPHYASETDLSTISPWLDSKGTPLPAVTDDISGVIRNVSHPDIGAVEFSANPAVATPLAGPYTIGSGGNYATIQSAFDDALIKGVSGPVDFQVMPGIHNEQIDIVSIPGTSPVNMVTLRSQSEDTSDTEITYTTSSQDDNFVVRFYGADFINLENLKITADGSTYAKVIDFYLGADSIALRDNSFNSVYNTNASTERSIIYSPDAYYFSRIIENNVFHDCSYGIYIRAAQNNVPYPLGAVIKNNQFKNCGYMGMYIQFYDAPQIIGNKIISNTYGIEAITCINELKILNNKISAGSQSGLYVGSSDAGDDHHGLIANNFVTVGGVGTAYGLNITSSSYQDVVHNSVNITSTHATNGRALYINSGNNLFFKNNILANNGGGYAYYNSTPAAVAESNYNDIYTTGTNLAYWNGVRTDLAALQTESTMDANSLSIDPGFTSDTDLHIASETLDGAGTPIAEVDVDIDYQNRHPLHPDIGADEFRTGLNSPPILVQAINDTILTQDISVNLIISDMNTVFDDPDTNDVLTFSAISSNVHVNAIIDSNSLFINYTVGYHGSAQIVVKATDLGNLSVTDTFIVTIIGVNDPPNAVDDHVQANTYIKDIIYVLNNDSDANDDPIQIIKVDQPEHGIVETKFENTEITYISYHYFTGIDSFRYHIEDQYGGSDSAMVYVEVIPLFEMVETGIVNVSHGSVAWGDFDNDDDLDIAISGWLGTINEYTSKIYRNDDTIFTDIEANLVNVSSSSPGCLDWGDADNDGDLDLLLCGLYQATPDVRYASRMYNNGQYGFLDFGYNDLEDVSSGSISWGDHNNDGLLDFLLSGSPTEGDDITNVYQHYDNLPGGTDFLNISAGVQSIWSGRSTWVDFDNDNDLDVFVCGFGAEPSKLYENTDGEYELMNSAIPGFGNADAAWGDYDNDGDMDLLICGKYLDNPTTKIYRNDGPAPSVGWIFTDIEADLQDVESGSVVWGDVDNNGDLDIVITGNSGGFGLKTELYLNHNGEFEHYDLDLQDVGRSAVAFGDYDNDNDLDLFITGVNNNQLTRFYKNNRVLTNQKPGTPTGLMAEVAGNSVVFKWNPAIDDSTSSKSLTYNIQVRSDEGTLLTVPGMSGENGYRKIPEYGNAGQDTSWILTDLDPGETYYWKVQAIDNSFIGSPFAKEQSFVITAIENINDLPKTFALYQNYPNPFNPSTKIKFDVPVSTDVKIVLYNILGEKVRTLVNKKYAPGRHEYVLEASGLAAGLYFYRIKTDQYMKTKRMILLK